MSTFAPRQVEAGSAKRWIYDSFILVIDHPVRWTGYYFAIFVSAFICVSIIQTYGFNFFSFIMMTTIIAFVHLLGMRVAARCDGLVDRVLTFSLARTTTAIFLAISTIAFIFWVISFAMPKIEMENHISIISMMNTIAGSLFVGLIGFRYPAQSALSTALHASGNVSFAESGLLAKAASIKNKDELKKVSRAGIALALIYIFDDVWLFNSITLASAMFLPAYIHAMTTDIFIGPRRYENVTQAELNPV